MPTERSLRALANRLKRLLCGPIGVLQSDEWNVERGTGNGGKETERKKGIINFPYASVKFMKVFTCPIIPKMPCQKNSI